MANGFGSLYIGKSGLSGSQTAINTIANNLSNINTQGYVRQQVVFTDTTYTTLKNTSYSKTRDQSINMQQSGLGVTIGDVVHNRDQFLDKYYRSESGRHEFYETCYNTAIEIETLLQETQGEAFQNVLADLNQAIQELAKDPGASVNQNLVIQKASLFVDRSNSLYKSLQEYQLNLNEQIIDTVKRINEIGSALVNVNSQIRTVEAGKVETAMTLRDERDNLLDELSSLANISYSEGADGVVKVKIEGAPFVDDLDFQRLDVRVDTITSFATPIWKQSSNISRKEYYDVFDFTNDISSETNTDIGKLKSLVMNRGTKVADFTDIYLSDYNTFEDTIALSPIETVEAQLDNLVHSIMTEINNVLSPTVEQSITKGGVTKKYLVWDETNGTVGGSLKGPGEEVFSRKSFSRYEKLVDDSGKTWYVFNEEDLGPERYDDRGKTIPRDTATYYSLINIEINKVLVEDETELPTLRRNGEVDYKKASELKLLFDKPLVNLKPGSNKSSFTTFYDSMVDEMASNGSIFNSVSNTLKASTESIQNQREQVIAVSSDEELSNMIKFQSAYNASSRFITTVDSMIEQMIAQLGS